MGDNPQGKDLKGKMALNWFLGEGSTLSPAESYRKPKLPTLRAKVHEVSCRHKAACEEFSGLSWNSLVQGSWCGFSLVHREWLCQPCVPQRKGISESRMRCLRQKEAGDGHVGVSLEEAMKTIRNGASLL